jgi:hypothetical protein
MDSRNFTRFGSLIASAGVIWTAQVATKGFTNLQALFPLPAGPMEVCGAGVILWLIGKWRASVRLR